MVPKVVLDLIQKEQWHGFQTEDSDAASETELCKAISVFGTLPRGTLTRPSALMDPRQGKMNLEPHFAVAQSSGFEAPNIVNPIVISVIYGIFVLGWGISLRAVINITRTRPRIFILFCLIGDFLAFTCTAVTIVGSYLTFNTYGFDADGETITQSQPVVLMHLQLLQPWAVSVNLLLSDFIVCWRAWVLLQHNGSWKLTLAIFMIVDAGVMFTHSESTFNSLENTFSGGAITANLKGDKDASVTKTFNWLSIVISLSLNIFATLLIAWKAWYEFIAHMSSQPVQFRNVVGNTIPPPASILVIIAAALYPIVVIILIHYTKSPVLEISSCS
ncbi:hypothetical protein BT96DRAFT_973663 [Gymnopus androsaceus JB14]|uniref:G-protein coupled receptors family 1 profile domain-containing protein n=1 Tax=Gymnopus androsaceus JB14 TaxID=1447944 RepID=A0A6A4HY60_9AGAR|nr:hypothetical protein BT96DRAFT_973663 [Gymnopus androsaceus JB14]